MKTLQIMAVAAILAFASTSAFATDADANSASESGAVSSQGQAIDSHDTIQASDMGDMVGAAIAPALTTTLTETCMGSTSIGAGWSGGGVSFGTTWRDSACVRRLDAREIKSIHPNFAVVAKELMCDSKNVYEAFKRAGIPCVDRDEDKEAEAPSTTSTKVPSRNVVSNDNGFFKY